MRYLFSSVGITVGHKTFSGPCNWKWFNRMLGIVCKKKYRFQVSHKSVGFRQGEGDWVVLCAEHCHFPANRFMIGTVKTGLNLACSKYIAERFIQWAKKSVFYSEWARCWNSQCIFSLCIAAFSLCFSRPGVFPWVFFCFLFFPP